MTRQQVRTWLLPAALLILAVCLRLLPGTRTIDDAFITFRYARNILSGAGFSYNPGEAVLGTTTPLYTLLLVLTGSISKQGETTFPQTALVINALADGITCILLLHLGRRLGSLRAGLGAALVWAMAPFSVTFAIGGLETSVYVLLLTATATAHVDNRHRLAALLGGLALLTRPDALLLLLPLAADRFLQTWQDRHSPAARPRAYLAEMLAFTLPVLPWLLFATISFGSPVPHSIAAKSLAYRLPPTAALVRLVQHYTTPFLEHLTFGLGWIAVGLVLYPFLFLIGARRAVRKVPHSWPFLVYPWLYFAAFAIANPLIFRWYLTPPLPAYILVILTGLDCLLGDILGRLKHPWPSQPPATYKTATLVMKAIPIGLVILAPVLLSARDWTLHPDHGLERPAPGMAWYQLELLYRQAATLLKPELPAAGSDLPVLAAGDVGVLGYFTPTRILDTVGLNSPEAVKYYPLDPACYAINYAVPPGLIFDQKPDFIVILEIYGRQCLLKDPRFGELYALRYKIPTDIYGSDGMLIFKRRAGS